MGNINNKYFGEGESFLENSSFTTQVAVVASELQHEAMVRKHFALQPHCFESTASL